MGADFAATGRPSMPAIHPKPNSTWEKQRAVRSVAHHATDADDFRELLEMLGLKAKDGKVSQTAKPTPFNTRARG